jgi:predicted alpha/beta-hydrolase family hydrolase
MHNYPRVIEAALEKIAMDMHARGKKGRIALVGHSMGGWASSQVSVEFVGDIKEKYGVDIVIELTAPAFKMH